MSDPLDNLLAVIHRDGGHYLEQHGEQKAVADAHLRWGRLMAALQTAENALAIQGSYRATDQAIILRALEEVRAVINS